MNKKERIGVEKIKVEPGIYEGVSFETYQSWGCINNSVLSIIAEKTALHAQEYILNQPEDTKAFLVGGAWHTAILEPALMQQRYIVEPDCDERTKEGKATMAEFEKNVGDKKILDAQEFDIIGKMAKVFRAHDVFKYINEGKAEVCIVWQDKHTGLMCKGRIDYARAAQAFLFDLKTTTDASPTAFHLMCKGRTDYARAAQAFLFDLKTTTDASPTAFQRSLYNYRYFQQAAFYCDGWQALTNDMPTFVFIAVEKSAPHAIAAYECHENTIAAGRKAYIEAITRYAECLETGKWPGYSNVQMMNLPNWALDKEGFSKLDMSNE